MKIKSNLQFSSITSVTALDAVDGQCVQSVFLFD